MNRSWLSRGEHGRLAGVLGDNSPLEGLEAVLKGVVGRGHFDSARVTAYSRLAPRRNRVGQLGSRTPRPRLGRSPSHRGIAETPPSRPFVWPGRSLYCRFPVGRRLRHHWITLCPTDRVPALSLALSPVQPLFASRVVAWQPPACLARMLHTPAMGSPDRGCTNEHAIREGMHPGTDTSSAAALRCPGR